MNRLFNPPGVAAPAASYSHGCEVPAGSRLLYVSGQVGTRPDGSVPPDVAGQTACVFENIKGVLAGAGMTWADVVKVNAYLVAGADLAAFRTERVKHMGDYRPASTLAIVAGLASPAFLVEVEVIAAKA